MGKQHRAVGRRGRRGRGVGRVKGGGDRRQRLACKHSITTYLGDDQVTAVEGGAAQTDEDLGGADNRESCIFLVDETVKPLFGALNNSLLLGAGKSQGCWMCDLDQRQ